MTQDTIQGNLNENNNNKAVLQFHWVNHNSIGNNILFLPQELIFRAIPYLLCFIQTVWIFFMKTTKTDFVGTVPGANKEQLPMFNSEQMDRNNCRHFNL